MADKKDDGGAYEFAPHEAEPRPAETTQPTAKPAAREAPQPEQLVAERTCPHCGHRIMGKPPRGRCPECAAALDELATDKLQFSDGAWLRRLSNGTLLVGAGIVVQMGGISLGMVERWRAGVLVQVVAAGAIMMGMWMATRQEPGIGTTRLPLAAYARWTSLIVAVLWLAELLKVMKTGVKLDEHGVPSRDMLTLMALTATAVEAVVAGLHFRMLAARVPSDSLVAHLFNLSFLVTAVCVGLIGLQLLGQANTKHISETFLCGFSIIGGMGVVMLWAVVTVLRLGIEIRNCAVAGENIAVRKAMKAAAKK